MALPANTNEASGDRTNLSGDGHKNEMTPTVMISSKHTYTHTSSLSIEQPDMLNKAFTPSVIDGFNESTASVESMQLIVDKGTLNSKDMDREDLPQEVGMRDRVPEILTKLSYRHVPSIFIYGFILLE
ncbi:hypothetical protein BGW38_008954 [Lunasporangiospora selenospora]|uniref:Uncharacterized protein n=1 Tax=Lunasporangiospora selenospora TaxID=979761 RepID=A0A9P6KG50_9FUNG|nr:hypothetical protein BGW38_008954 [Lunasporangiospora selenospora]